MDSASEPHACEACYRTAVVPTFHSTMRRRSRRRSTREIIGVDYYSDHFENEWGRYRVPSAI